MRWWITWCGIWARTGEHDLTRRRPFALGVASAGEQRVRSSTTSPALSSTTLDVLISTYGQEPESRTLAPGPLSSGEGGPPGRPDGLR